jgi:hypothetical protein
VLLVSPADHHRDGDRLAQAGLRVITTSQVVQTAAQMLRAAPAAVVIELVPAFARETAAFVAELTSAARRRGIALIVYGPRAGEREIAAIRASNAAWIEVTGVDRTAIVNAVGQALTDGESRARSYS